MLRRFAQSPDGPALQLAYELRQASLDVRFLSEREIRRVLEEQGMLDWSVKDLLWALDYTPDGTEQPTVLRRDMHRGVERWLERRLAIWRGEDPPWQADMARQLAEQQELRRRQRLRRLMWQAEADSAVPAPPQVREELQAMRARRPGRRKSLGKAEQPH